MLVGARPASPLTGATSTSEFPKAKRSEVHQVGPIQTMTNSCNQVSRSENGKHRLEFLQRILLRFIALTPQYEWVESLQQIALALKPKPARGGARTGAGRPSRAAALRHTPHRARPPHRAESPVHVTLRAFSRSLRMQFIARAVLRSIKDSQRAGFRAVHYSIQDNHLHLIVEAENRTALSSAVRGLVVRIARRVNQLLFRRGRFWADRWHGRALKSPREVRNALVYVLKNRSKHVGAHGAALDPLSSAEWFNGFAEPLPRNFRSMMPCAHAPPRTWLLTVGWRRHGTIGLKERPHG